MGNMLAFGICEVLGVEEFVELVVIVSDKVGMFDDEVYEVLGD